MLHNFLFRVARLKGGWSMKGFVKQAIADIHTRVGARGQVLLGLSGGVDSTVAATLLHRAIGAAPEVRAGEPRHAARG